MFRATPLVAAAMALLGACGGASGGGSGGGITQPPQTPTLSLSGGGYTDTISAPDPTLLTITLHKGDGSADAGVPIQVASNDLYLRPPDGSLSALGATVQLPTDAQGQVQVGVVLGTIAGTASATVTVPSLGLTASASYTVLAGAPVTVQIVPVVTIGSVPPAEAFIALLPGRSRTIAVRMLDRSHNTATGTPTFDASGDVASVSTGGAVTAGSAPGAGMVYARVGSAYDSLLVQVLPAVRVATYFTTQPFALQQLVLMNLDSTQKRILSDSSTREAPPIWSPDGSQIIYSDVRDSTDMKIMAIDTLRASLTRFPTGSVKFTDLSGFCFGSDALHLLVNGAVAGGANHLWKVGLADGSVVELADSLTLLPNTAPSTFAGGHTALVVTADHRMVAVDLGSGSAATLGAGAVGAAYAPDGQSVAFLPLGTGAGLFRLDLNGGNQSALGTSGMGGASYTESRMLSFTSDGKWIVTGGMPVLAPLMAVLQSTDGSTILMTPLKASGVIGFQGMAPHP